MFLSEIAEISEISEIADAFVTELVVRPSLIQAVVSKGGAFVNCSPSSVREFFYFPEKDHKLTRHDQRFITKLNHSRRHVYQIYSLFSGTVWKQVKYFLIKIKNMTKFRRKSDWQLFTFLSFCFLQKYEIFYSTWIILWFQQLLRPS